MNEVELEMYIYKCDVFVLLLDRKTWRYFATCLYKIRKLQLKISTDVPSNISFPAVWIKYTDKKHKKTSILAWPKVYIKKSVLKLTS